MKKGSDFTKLLKAKNLRATPSRLRILETLDQSEQPLSAEDLSSKLSKFDLVTLYRNLNCFVENGVVAPVELGLGKVLFEILNEGHHHHHIICKECKKIAHLEVCGMEPHIKMLEAMGYQKISHRLEFYGLCQNCHSPN